MNANDILTENVMTVDQSTRVKDAIELLQRLDIRHLPVVSPTGELVGMVSDRDIRNSGTPFTLLPESTEEDGETVVDLMSSNVVSVTPETELDEIIDLMIEHRIGAVPVVEAGTNELAGIVSYIDVLRAVRART